MPFYHTFRLGNWQRSALGVLCMIIMAATLGASAPAVADVYRWQDAQGNWHFSDTPPAGRTFQRMPDATPSAPPQQNGSQFQPQAPVNDEPTEEGLLWRISRNGQPPSYLLGTIHSEDHRVTRLRPGVSQVLDQSDRFVMEMKLDTNAFMHFGALMLMEEGQDLETLVGSQLYAQVEAAMSGSGVPGPMVRRLKPWVVISMLSMPKSTGGLILDMVLYQRATGRKIPTFGLESAQEQLSVFEDLSQQDQIDLLKLTVAQLPEQANLFEQLIQAYVADDLGAIQKIAQQSNLTKESAAARRFMARLNDQRNLRMAQRMIPYLEKGNSFISAGALHLGGSQGLLALLRNQGYDTTPVR